ncbi:MAG: sensor histidine kinase [Oscillospiraceae bacterium]|nr:sensor histidine kinase [Oscillospiraceae bacterium]
MFHRKAKTLRKKILTLNVCIIIGAFCLFTVIFLRITYRRIHSELLKSSSASFQQTETLLTEKMDSLRNEMDLICLNTQVEDLLTADNSRKYKDLLSWNIDATEIKDKINSVLYQSNIDGVTVITQNPIAQADPFCKLSSVQKTKWYNCVHPSNSSFIWTQVTDLDSTGKNDPHVCFTRKLPYVYQEYETYFVGFLKKDYLETLLNANITDAYASCYAVDKKGTLLFGKNMENEEETGRISGWIRTRQAKSDTLIPIQNVSLDGQDYFIGAQNIENTNVTLIYTYSFSKKSSDIIRENLLLMLSIIAVVLPLVFLFSFLTAGSITKPLETLKKSMIEASRGNFDIALPPLSSDVEVQTLTSCFRYMLTKISILLDKQYNYGKQIKDLELKSLQAQINPHFLYNTLDLINWKAVKDGNKEIQNLVVALSSYYRKGLSKGANYVTLQSEIEHITAFTYIENMRFDNGITLKIDVSDKCSSCKVPKLILQPLVENSISHGILETDDTRGTVLVKARRRGGTLYVAVVDNGIGMEQKTADGLLRSDTRKSERAHYGIWNINERLKLSFGPEYRLTLISHIGRGTAVILKMPFHTEEKNDNV